MAEYLKRVADEILTDKLSAMGAVLVEGPKYCGKTTLSRQQAGSELLMTDPDTQEQNMVLAQTKIRRLLEGKTPRLIDEWQVTPQLWDAVRNEVDRRGEDGQFILTGSAVPPDTSQIVHTGTGRIARLKLRTMSLWESRDSTGNVSLAQLFKNSKDVDGQSFLTIDDIAFLTCRGGWPKAVLKTNPKIALISAIEYCESVVQYDVSRVDNVDRNPDLAAKLMRSYARHQGNQTGVGSILEDIKTSEQDKLGENTVYAYLKALKQIFVIEDLSAWNPNLRSRTAIRTSDTHYFTDPSIATAALGLGPEDLMNDLKTFGLFFETLCIRDLRVYADALSGNVYHYRDKNGLECDAVIHLRNGHYGLIEIKLGGETQINEGAKNLLRLASKIDTDKMPPPSFLLVLTAIGQYPYRRPVDDVLVVPVGCLKN